MNATPEPDPSEREDETLFDVLLDWMGAERKVDGIAFKPETWSFGPVKGQPYTHILTVDPNDLPADMPQHWKDWILGKGEQPPQ